MFKEKFNEISSKMFTKASKNDCYNAIQEMNEVLDDARQFIDDDTIEFLAERMATINSYFLPAKTKKQKSVIDWASLASAKMRKNENDMRFYRYLGIYMQEYGGYAFTDVHRLHICKHEYKGDFYNPASRNFINSFEKWGNTYTKTYPTPDFLSIFSKEEENYNPLHIDTIKLLDGGEFITFDGVPTEISFRYKYYLDAISLSDDYSVKYIGGTLYVLHANGNKAVIMGLRKEQEIENNGTD